MQITVYKETALTRLKTNRQQHIDEFAAQMQGWKLAMEQFTKSLAEWSTRNSENIFEADDVMKMIKKQRPEEPSKPYNYVHEYDAYIELIEANVTTTINIDEHEFKHIIKNQFSWSKTFAFNSSIYNSLGQ